MKKLATICAAVALLASAAFAQVTADQAEQAYKLLEATNDQLVFSGDYTATISITIEKPGKPNSSLKYKVFERTETETFTIVQLFPEADKGSGFLRDGDNIWMYDPIGRKFSHVSLKEQISDSDIKLDDLTRASDHWRKNYTITGMEEGKLGQYAVYIVSVEAKTSDPAYEKSTYYIRKDVPLLLKESDYSANGRLMRTILIPKYAKTAHGYIGYQTIVRDELNPGEQTTQVISDLSFDPLPDRIFTKAYLEGLN
ncbi:MAG: outer membrane lipoprotein-sorting protein [Treponemataceae bacterium]|nr:outer membrane lipoprotein-sorting protein [Treponemataceae bacterium]